MKKCKYSKLSNYILEGIGSFFLVFFAAGAVMSNAFYNGPIGQIMGGFSSGLILFILISSLGKYSRGHVNPAVTIMEFRLGFIGSRTAFFYIIFQTKSLRKFGVLFKIRISFLQKSITTFFGFICSISKSCSFSCIYLLTY